MQTVTGNRPASTLLKLAHIITTAGTQIRARIDEDTVCQYSESMQDATIKFPPVVVFHDGKEYVLADGFHRVMAATRNGFLDIEAEVHKGTRADALKYALGANVAHGLRRTNADKRRSVELALTEWPTLSDRQIAETCAVGDHLVADVRSSNCVNHAVDEPQPRIGKDGKTRRLPLRHAPIPAPDVQPSTTPEPPEPEDQPQVVADTRPRRRACIPLVEDYMDAHPKSRGEIALFILCDRTSRVRLSVSKEKMRALFEGWIAGKNVEAQR